MVEWHPTRSAWTAVVLVMSTLVAGGSSARDWQLVNPLPTDADLAGVACGAPGCVAVGEAGTILSSADGAVWTATPSPVTVDLAAVAWSGSAFVAVGSAGTILVSRDSSSWEPRSSGTAADLEGVCAGPMRLLVVVGENGTILTSTDDRTWGAQESETATTLRDVTWAEQGFVAVGDRGPDGKATLLTSPDGRHWRSDSRATWGDLRFVAAHGAEVVIGNGARHPLASHLTRDGLGEITQGAMDSWAAYPDDAVWCGECFAGVSRGPSYNGYGHHSFSHDPLSWFGTLSREQWLPLGAVACGPDGPVAVGPGGQTATSPDGVHWRRGSAQVEETLALAGDQDHLVALTVPDPEAWWGSASSRVLASRAGVVWSGPSLVPVENFHGSRLAFGAGVFVLAGSRWAFPPHAYGAVAVSPDGVAWEPADLDVTVAWLSAVTWDGSRFVAVGNDRMFSTVVVCTSVDGVSWEGRSTSAGTAFVALASDGERLVAVDDSGSYVLRLADGSTWEEVTPPLPVPWHDVAFAAGEFVLVGEGGAIVSSSDGAIWVERPSGTESDLYGVDRIGDGFVVTGADGTLLTSADGVTWQPEVTGLAGDLMSAAPSACGLTVTGRHGLIATTVCTDDGPPRAAFSWRPPSPVAGTPVHLLDRSTPAPDRWRWDLGDGTAATGPETVHTWAAAGTYPVTLDVSNRHGASQATSAVEVLAPCGPVGTPTGLAAPAQVGRWESLRLTWDPVEGADGYRVEIGRCSPTACQYEFGETSETVFDARSGGGASITLRVQSVHRCFDGGWRSAWSQPVTVTVLPTITEPWGALTVVPAVAHGPGGSGQVWATDLLLRNRDAEVRGAEVFPLDGAPELGKVLEVAVEAGENVVVRDVLARIPGAPSSCGLLIGLGHGLELEVRSRSATATEVVPTLAADQAVRDREPRMLTGLLREGSLVTNVGAANPGRTPLELFFLVIAADGRPLGVVRLDLPAYGSATVTDLLGRLGLSEVRAARATVRRISSAAAPYVAWSSVVDRDSGDAVTRLATQEPLGWSVFETNPRPYGDSGVAFGNGTYVTVGAGVSWSRDARHWQRQSLGLNPSRVRWNGDTFVVVGDGRVARSADAELWEVRDLPRGRFYDLLWTDDEWLAVGSDGDHGLVGRSPDGLDWALEDLPDIPAMGRVASLGSGFVATAEEGVVLASPDGSAWTPTWPFPGFRFWDVASSGSAAVVVGQRSGTSVDGVHWHPLGTRYKGVDWLGGWFVATRDGLEVSRDGRSWRELGLLDGSYDPYPFELAWDGAVSFGPSTDETVVWLAEAGPALVVPGARHGVDDQGRPWRTDLHLTNTGDDEVACALDPLGPDGPLAAPVTVTIPPSATLRLDDVLDSLFTLNGGAAVRVVPSAPTVVGAGRTYAPTAAGTVGQAAPALPEETAIWHFAEGRLWGLERSASVRTDLGLVSLCEGAMTVNVRLLGPDGAELGGLAVDLPPFAARDLADVLLAVGAGEVEAASAVLTTDTRCPFLAFASRVDLATGDRVLVPAVAASLD